MYFDKYSQIGSSHKVNEDYAVVGNDTNPFVVVSDGCSSSPDTDIGSRILALTTARCLMRYKTIDVKELMFNVLIDANAVAMSLGVSTRCLDATLLIARVVEDRVNVIMYGDGCLYAVPKGNSPVVVHTVEYTPEMPYYPSYKLNMENDRSYMDQAGSLSLRKIEQTELLGQGDSFRANTNPILPTTFSYPIDDLSAILLTTDGVGTFIADKPCNVYRQSYIDSELTNFKSFKGEFVQRRMKRMMKNNIADGVTHYDDFTAAGISFC